MALFLTACPDLVFWREGARIGDAIEDVDGLRALFAVVERVVAGEALDVLSPVPDVWRMRLGPAAVGAWSWLARVWADHSDAAHQEHR